MPSCSPGIERAKPLLGTRVAVRVHGLATRAAHEAIDAAFAEVAAVHALMSFHEPHSDVSRLNREAHNGRVGVDARTRAVLDRALDISERSAGAFDVTVAPVLVSRGLLPRPDGEDADRAATWRDIVLEADGSVRFRRSLWIDLGGIAKGYAVDRAMEALKAFGLQRASVNAGGDLAVIGREHVRLAPEPYAEETVPLVEIADGAVASSCGRTGAAHVDPSGRPAGSSPVFACVMAPSCMDADALTKVVMMRGPESATVLAAFRAKAAAYGAGCGWREFQGAA